MGLDVAMATSFLRACFAEIRSSCLFCAVVDLIGL